MAAISDERALATRLAALDDDALTRLLAARGVSSTAPWRGFFDAAEALLDEASVDRVLVGLPRQALSALASGEPLAADVRERLAALGLVDADGTPFAVVRQRVDAASSASPDAFTPEVSVDAPAPADRVGAAASAERALTAAAALADLLLAARDTGVTTTAGGTVSAVDRKRLVEDGVVIDADELEDLLAAGADAGLVRLVDREWAVTDASEDWLVAHAVDRWLAVVTGFRAALPDALRTATDGFIPIAAWSDVYPLDPDWPARAEALRRRAVRWGLIQADGSEPAWGRTLREGGAVDTASLIALLPTEIDRVYLQADLSAIAPGPLHAALDLRLRGMADRESRAQASTYRFSAESLARAVAGGETADSIRGFLQELSLTGIPQPLDYLVDRAARGARVRVRRDDTGLTRVETDDAGLRETIAVDSGLRALGLVPNGDALVSKVARDPVYWALVDARYPAIAVEADGMPVTLRRRRVAAGESSNGHDYGPLVRTLRAATAADTDAAWLERELDQAVRARALIDVEVRLPSGEQRTFTLEATGLGGGRLRGRDRAADVERTVPVSSITRIRSTP